MLRHGAGTAVASLAGGRWDCRARGMPAVPGAVNDSHAAQPSQATSQASQAGPWWWLILFVQWLRLGFNVQESWLLDTSSFSLPGSPALAFKVFFVARLFRSVFFHSFSKWIFFESSFDCAYRPRCLWGPQDSPSISHENPWSHDSHAWPSPWRARSAFASAWLAVAAPSRKLWWP